MADKIGTWCGRHRDKLEARLQRGCASFGLFVAFADTLPHPFGHTAFGRWTEGVSVCELRAFWDKYRVK